MLILVCDAPAKPPAGSRGGVGLELGPRGASAAVNPMAACTGLANRRASCQAYNFINMQRVRGSISATCLMTKAQYLILLLLPSHCCV